MINTKFFRDLENIKAWVEEEHFQVGQLGTDEGAAYIAALEKMEQLNNELHKLFYDEEKYGYRYPTEEELEKDSKKQSMLLEGLDEYYLEVIKSAEGYFKYVEQWNQTNKEKQEIKIPAAFYTIYNYAKRDMWEREDARKEKHRLIDQSEIMENLRKAMDAPTDMKELAAMDDQLKELVVKEQEIEKEERSLDEPEEVKQQEEELEGKEEYLESLSEEERAELTKEEEEKLAKQQEEEKLSKEVKEKQEALAKAEVEKKLQALDEAARKEQEAIKEHSEKAQETLESEVEQLMKQMQNADKGLFHINSREFKKMRDSLYSLANFTKQLREKNKNGENTILDQKTKEELQEKINTLQAATDEYVTRKGMGQQKTTRGKKRIELAYNIGNFLTNVRENSRKKYNALEQKEIRRLEWEEKNYDKLQAIKEENGKIAEFSKISPLYGRSLYEFSKVEGLENLPQETLFQKKLKEDYQKLLNLMYSNADVRLVKAARSSLSTTRFLVMKEGKFEDLSEEIQNTIAKMNLNTPKWERAEQGDITKFRNTDFLKERLKEYEPIMERLGELEDAPYAIREFVERYKELINETDPERLKPEYFQFQIKNMKDSLYSIGRLIKRNEIYLPYKEEQNLDSIDDKDLYNIIDFSLNRDLDVIEHHFLSFSRSEVKQAMSPQFFIKDVYHKYGKFIEQMAEQCPEVKEAKEWMDEELNSPHTDANRIAGFMTRVLYKAITNDNVKKYNVSFEGIEPDETEYLINHIRSSLSKNSNYLVSSYSVGSRAVKQREDRKTIEHHLEEVKNYYGEENHATLFFEKLSKALLTMNDGSGPYHYVLKRYSQLHKSLTSGRDIYRKDVVNSLNDMLTSLNDLAVNPDLKDPGRISEVLQKITKECKEEKEFSQSEQERIAEEERIAREKAIEEEKHSKYKYRDLRQLVKDNFQQLKEQRIFQGYEKTAEAFEKCMLHFNENQERLLSGFKQFNTVLSLVDREKKAPVKEILEQFSKEIESRIQGIQKEKVEKAWNVYFKDNKEILDEFSKKRGMNTLAQKRKRYDYAHRLVALKTLGIDRSFLNDVDYSLLKERSDKNLSEADKVENRIQGNMEIALELKSINKLLKNEKIMSEDLVHDKILLEMAKFSNRIKKKIDKYQGMDRINFLDNSAKGINDMLDSYEKFLKEKYQNKELSFYKEEPGAALEAEDVLKDLDKDNPSDKLYKEWKEQQLIHRMEMKHQGMMTGKDQVKAVGVISKIDRERKLLSHKYIEKEEKRIELKYLVANKLNLPMDAFHSLETEITNSRNKAGQEEKAEKMFEEMGYDQEVDKYQLRRNRELYVDYQTKANVMAYYLMKEAKGKEIPTLKEVGDFLYVPGNYITKNSDISYEYSFVLKYCQYQKAYVKQERREELYENAKYQCRGIQFFKKPIDADKFAYRSLLNAVMEQKDLTDSFAFQLEETISNDKMASKIIQQPEGVKAILKVIKSVKEGNLTNLKFMDAFCEYQVAAIEDCRDAYRNITKAQLGREIMKQLNEMSVEKRKEYLEHGGAERIQKRFESLEQFLDSKIPGFLKAEDGKVQDKLIMNKTMLLLQEDRFKEFAAYEKELKEAEKTGAGKEKPEAEIEAEAAL